MKIALSATLLILAAIVIHFYLQPKVIPIYELPESERCAVIGQRRDTGTINIPLGFTKDQVRAVLGRPQNTDADGKVWIWLFDLDGHIAKKIPRDAKTMLQKSGHSDGYWLGFDKEEKVSSSLLSFSAQMPPVNK